MIQRSLAWSLLVLALSPFTAPFSTCDLATLFGHETVVVMDAPFVHAASSSAGAVVDDAALVASPNAPNRAKLSAIATVAVPPVLTNHAPVPAHSWPSGPTPLSDKQPRLYAVLRL